MIGSPCSNRPMISSLLLSNPCGPTFHDEILGSSSVWTCAPTEPRWRNHRNLSDISSAFQASLLASSFSHLAALPFMTLPSEPIRASPCAASVDRPLRLSLLIQTGTLVLRAVKKSQYAVHALLGFVVDGSSHSLSMPHMASYSSSVNSQSRSLSPQPGPPGRVCGTTASGT